MRIGWPQMSPAPSSYFVEADDHIKIGIARDVRSHIAQLQTGCPYKVELRGVMANGNPALLEQILHDFFGDHAENGEWHRFSYEQIEEVAKRFEEWAQGIAKQLREILH
jgi:Meiotically up-regulated gene 113